MALPVPEPVRADLAAAVGAVSLRRDRALRWVRPEAYHLTLTFLGAVEARVSADLEVRLARAAARCPPLELGLGAPGRFGRRVVWVGVDGDRDRLTRLAAATTAAARRAGLDVDLRPYRPHLTLARASGDADLEPVVAALATALSTDVAPRWRADELQLLQSRLGAGPGGTARHEVVARWALAAVT